MLLRRSLGLGWISVLALSVSFAASAEGGFPDPTKDYSADFTMQIEGGQSERLESKGREQFHAGHRRRDMTTLGRSMTVITRADGTTWTLMPEMKMYMVSKAGQTSGEASPDPMSVPDAKLTKVGRETVNGVAADKYTVTSEGSKGTAWMTPDHVPVRYIGSMEESGRSMKFRMEYTNHQFGAVASERFELPAGYSPLPSFGGGMGLPSGMNPAQPPSGADAQKQLEALRRQAEKFKRSRGP